MLVTIPTPSFFLSPVNRPHRRETQTLTDPPATEWQTIETELPEPPHSRSELVPEPAVSEAAVPPGKLSHFGSSQTRIAAVAAAATVLLLLAPLWLISSIAEENRMSRQTGTLAEAAVGIGVILRATARRVVQFGARGALRTAVSTVLRAIARTVTRRFTRVLLHTSAGTFSRNLANRGMDADAVSSIARSRWSLLIGVVGLAASFYGSVLVSDQLSRDSITQDFSLAWPAMVVLAALPMIIYAGLIHVAGRVHGATTRFATELDGILLQGYFTGAGSFLPMLTDMVIHGDPKQRGKTALWALGVLYVLHLVTFAIGYLTGNGAALFVASMLLIYAFIYCFPIHPMEGYAIWKYSRLKWCGLFIPILISFLVAFPESLLGVV